MNLNESYEYCVQLVKKQIDNIEAIIITEDNQEFFFGVNETGTAMRIIKFKYPFLILFIENNEFDFNFDKFSDKNLLMILLNDFVNGDYYYQLDFKTQKIISLWWINNELIPFNFGNIQEELNAIKGVSLKLYKWN